MFNSFGSTFDSCPVSCTGSNEVTGCSLHATSRSPIEPENPCGLVVAQSSAWNILRRGSSLVHIWSRHASHCRGCPKLYPSRWTRTPAVCPMLNFEPSHPTTFLLSVFAFRSFQLVTNDWVISVLESDGGVVWLKYVEPGSAMMLMCSSVMIFLWCLCRCQELVSKFDPCGHQRILHECGSVIKLIIILLEFLMSFAAFGADLASIDNLRSVDRRHKTKIMQN